MVGIMAMLERSVTRAQMAMAALGWGPWEILTAEYKVLAYLWRWASRWKLQWECWLRLV
jgi:hypothetical protein